MKKIPAVKLPRTYLTTQYMEIIPRNNLLKKLAEIVCAFR